MTEIPDDVRGAEILEAEMLAHTAAPEVTADWLHCKAMEIATVKAAYAEARARDAEGADDALRAADEWHHLTLVVAAALDDLKSTGRWAATRTPPGITPLGCWRD